MRRRRYLAVVGAAAIAGCNSFAEDVSQGDSPFGGQVTDPGNSDNDTATRTTNESGAEIVRHELTETEGGTTIIRGRVRNTSSREINLVRLTGEFYDSSGTILKQSVSVVQYLAPGDTHAFRIWYLNQEQPPSDYDLWMEAVGASATTENSGEINVASDDIQGFQQDHWGVQGKIENASGRDFREVQIFSKFYAGESFVEYMGLDAVKRFNPSDTYQFQVYYKGGLEREAIQQYELLVRYLEE